MVIKLPNSNSNRIKNSLPSIYFSPFDDFFNMIRVTVERKEDVNCKNKENIIHVTEMNYISLLNKEFISERLFTIIKSSIESQITEKNSEGTQSPLDAAIILCTIPLDNYPLVKNIIIRTSTKQRCDEDNGLIVAAHLRKIIQDYFPMFLFSYLNILTKNQHMQSITIHKHEFTEIAYDASNGIISCKHTPTFDDDISFFPCRTGIATDFIHTSIRRFNIRHARESGCDEIIPAVINPETNIFLTIDTWMTRTLDKCDDSYNIKDSDIFDLLSASVPVNYGIGYVDYEGRKCEAIKELGGRYVIQTYQFGTLSGNKSGETVLNVETIDAKGRERCIPFRSLRILYDWSGDNTLSIEDNPHRLDSFQSLIQKYIEQLEAEQEKYLLIVAALLHREFSVEEVDIVQYRIGTVYYDEVDNQIDVLENILPANITRYTVNLNELLKVES